MRTPLALIFSLICLAVLLASPAVCFADGCPGDSAAGSSLESHDDGPVIGKSSSAALPAASGPTGLVWSVARPALRVAEEGPSCLAVVPLRI